MLQVDELKESAIQLLKDLIRIPSFSGKEDGTADVIVRFFISNSIESTRIKNNVIAKNRKWKEGQPTLLLNSHHDTVKVVNGWTFGPHDASEENGCIYGLGSNDAGASLVSLIATFTFFYDWDLPFNIILLASAEEENFGPNGVKALVDSELKKVDFGIVGEPTNMEIAVAEKGLIVIDALARGKAGHAARKEGENAIYKAVRDIQRIEKFEFDKISETLGPNVVSVTQVNAGVQHNVVPDACRFVLDVRVNELYTLEEAFHILDDLCDAELKERSFNNRSSGIAKDHSLVKAARALDISTFGSATLSDQANLPFPTIKMGPGFSERSHTPDEFIKRVEIENGIEVYIEFLKELRNHL
jgi:acetylornithine deacetylase